MLVVGDVHGNHAKAKMFLEYKPEEQHLFVGDYTDSFCATDDEILQTMQLIFNSDAILLSGNHDNQYYRNSTVAQKCTGFRESYSFVHMIEGYKDKLKASHAVDDYIITHGGVHPNIGKPFDNVYDLSDWLNSEFDQWKNSIVSQQHLSKIFNIGTCRGGWDTFSGIFWADYRHEKFDKRFNQIFGHSHSSAKIISVGKQHVRKHHICIDCPEFLCFNTTTGRIEDFFPLQLNHLRYTLEKTY
jgi:predicted phosphodiesterase